MPDDMMQLSARVANLVEYADKPVSRCVCFTTDIGYLFPTLLSAIQAKRFLRSEVADVVVILFGAKEDASAYDDICRSENINLILADNAVLQGNSAMYARLFLDRLLPQHYTRLLYIDGDVQITQPLNELIQADLGSSAFSAVADPMAVFSHRRDTAKSAEIDAYFAGLGVNSTLELPYFNSGILLIDREAWREVSVDALMFIQKSPELCRFQDQSALNFAGHRKFTPMSFKWNFPIFFMNCGVEGQIQPGIYHFMSKPKPWNGNFAPWNAKFVTPYVELQSKYPALRSLVRPMPARVRGKYLLQQNFKRIQETFSWRYSNLRSGILEFDSAAKV
jgi:lipopolysaccharide biosynthesis glycosyltransferase